MKKLKELVLNFFNKKRLIRWGIFIGICLILFLCRRPILRGVGNWLINEDKLENADAIIMLGGNSLERGSLTYKLFIDGFAPFVVTTGKNQSNDLASYGIHITEAEQSKKYLTQLGVDSSRIIALEKGTSTIEEAYAIKKLTNERNWKKIIIVTSKFHTFRVKKYFGNIFNDANVKLIVRGCQPLKYKINQWWYSEEGLIMVNNEYIKGFYYWWNY